MSDLDPGTTSGEDLVEEPQPAGAEGGVAQPPTAQQQGQEGGRCDLTPDVSQSPKPERFRSSNQIEDWIAVSRDEARGSSSEDSGHGDDYKSNLDADQDDPSTSSTNRQRTGMTNRGGAGDETALKAMTTAKPQQPHLGPAGAVGNVLGVVHTRDQTYTQQSHEEPADIRRESDPTGAKSGRGSVDVRPEQNPTQKRPIQADAIQTQKQELKGEMNKRRDTRIGTSSKRLTVAESIERSKPADLSEMPNRNTDRVRTSSPMQMSPAGEQVVGGSSEPLGQEHGPSATEVITPSGTTERSTCVKQSGGTTERVQTPLEPGPTPADSEEADRDTDVPCTTSVGFLLDLTEGGRNNTIKERIMFEMSHYPVSRLQSAYGLGAQFLGYEHWQLEKLWEAQIPGCDAKVERVRNILKALEAEGKTMNDVLLYFIHEASRRLDIVKLIMDIHQCDCCKKVFKNVNM